MHPVRAIDARLLRFALAGSALTYLAHPPAGWSLMAWLGPVPWLWIALVPALPGRRPYATLWLAGFAYWMATIAWLRLPHPANHLALVLIAAYLGLYLPLFLGLSRVAVHRLRVPLWAAAPVVWTGLELARAHLLTGFLMGSLAQSQYRTPIVIQIADLAGEYAVTFVILLVAASLARASYPRIAPVMTDSAALHAPPRPRQLASHLLPAVVALSGTLVYGQWRLEAIEPTGKAPVIALIQGDTLADWKGSADKERRIMDEQRQLSLDAARQSRAQFDAPPDVIVWPETMFRQHLVTLQDDSPIATAADLRASLGESTYLAARNDLQVLTRETGSALIVGVDRVHARVGPANAQGQPTLEYANYNSSVGVDRQGEIVGTYDKVHLLPFGEYIPLVDWLPWLRKYSPITGSASPGTGPAAFVLDGVTYAPNICYESALPHLVRRHVQELADAGQAPDILVNLTNDAWYWGSSELDIHLACGVLRAVETRTPLVVAANRGLSAHVDERGRIVAVSPRDQPYVLLTQVRIPGGNRGPTGYVRTGDWLAATCLVCCMILAWRGR
jgi:apolipoprotein N-acyltransferase